MKAPAEAAADVELRAYVRAFETGLTVPELFAFVRQRELGERDELVFEERERNPIARVGASRRAKPFRVLIGVEKADSTEAQRRFGSAVGPLCLGAAWSSDGCDACGPDAVGSRAVLRRHGASLELAVYDASSGSGRRRLWNRRPIRTEPSRAAFAMPTWSLLGHSHERDHALPGERQRHPPIRHGDAGALDEVLARRSLPGNERARGGARDVKRHASR
jgi:hypothetical protein